MAPPEKPAEPVGTDKLSRQQRLARYKVWLLQKRLAELGAQVEAAVLEVCSVLYVYKLFLSSHAVTGPAGATADILEAGIPATYCSGTDK